MNSDEDQGRFRQTPARISSSFIYTPLRPSLVSLLWYPWIFLPPPKVQCLSDEMGLSGASKAGSEPDGKILNEMESQKVYSQQNMVPRGTPELPLSSFELRHVHPIVVLANSSVCVSAVHVRGRRSRAPTRQTVAVMKGCITGSSKQGSGLSRSRTPKNTMMCH